MRVVETQVKEIDTLESADFQTDPETGKMTAKIAIIKAGRAKNPRNYRPAALEKAAKEGVYNGMRMFIDHSDKPPIRRKMTELVSAVESTVWDPTLGPKGGIQGEVTFFNKDFFDYAQAAKKYIGVSADHRIRVIPAQEGRKTIEDVLEIAFARSVDWVLYPSAGGEVLQFAKESEGDDQVEWGDITLDELKANVPQLVEQIKSEVKPAQENEDDTPPPASLTAQEVSDLVAKGVQEAIDKMAEKDSKRDETSKAIRDFVAKSGLRPRVQSRIINMFADALEYVEADVQAAVEDAKEEMKELGVGPKVTGEGPSGEAGKGKPTTTNAREGVEAIFGLEKKA